MKHTPHPALIGSYNNARGLNEMLAAAKKARQEAEDPKLSLWARAWLKVAKGWK